MIIKKLSVERFGKLKDIKLEFHPGLNVIYGRNEAGKSTLQAFMKAMFYGMNSKKKDIRENDRKHFLPWSGERASGELYFEDDYCNEYIIKRNFGLRKKEDDSTLLHSISGDLAGHVDHDKPGVDILGLGEEAFEKTLFIKQLGAGVGRDKEDEIMKRLINLQQTGEEDTSYHKGKQALLEGKKYLFNPRKTGKIDKLREKLEALQEELGRSKTLYDENIQDHINWKDLINKKEILNSEIEKAEKYKKRIKYSKSYKEYEQLSQYIQEIESYLKELEKLPLIDESSMGEIKEKQLLWNQQKRLMREMKEGLDSLERKAEEKEALLEKFYGYRDLDENIEIKMITIEKDNKYIQEKIKEIETNQKEMTQLVEALEEQRKSLGSIRNFETVNESIERGIYDLEERLKELNNKIDHNEKENLLYRKNILKNQKKDKGLMILLGILMLMGGLLGGIFLNLYFYGLGGVGLLLSLISSIQRKKISSQIRMIGEDINRHTGQINEEIDRITYQLSETYNALGVSGYKEFRMAMRKYIEKKDQIAIRKAKIEEKKYQMDKYETRELKEKLSNNNKFIHDLLKKCKCENMNKFMMGLKKYHNILEDKVGLENERIHIQQRINHEYVYLKESEDFLIKKLQPLVQKELDENKIEKSMNQLLEQLDKRIQMERELYALEETYKALLKDRSIEKIKKDLDPFQKSEFIEEIVDEEELENSLKEMNEEKNTTETEINLVAFRIENKFSKTRDQVQIEEEIEEIKEKIHHYEGISKSLDMAGDTLEEAFKEIQRDFGPKLNRVVGDVLKKITREKYQDVKISEDYGIKILDPVENNIKRAEYFSNGTWDQIYFALRMGMIHMIFEENQSFPLILDDPFIQYDDFRLKSILEYLYEYGKKHQVILFTCQRREEEALKGLSNIHFIHL